MDVFDMKILVLAEQTGEDMSPLNLLIMISIFMLLGIFAPRIYSSISKIILPVLRSIKIARRLEKIEDYHSLNQVLEEAGYFYDTSQDIFYSNLNAWQRDMGYCRLYDEAAALLSMIIDCEPIYFNYNNKHWLIEFWKGQYGMTTGCEIGVYSTDGPVLNTGIYNNTFYDCASDEELLDMSFTLRKNGKTLLERRGRHWWLTGFKLGEFSEPWELVAYINITLKDKEMRNEFIKGLIKAGYSKKEIVIIGNSVALEFDKPRTKQPYTRVKAADEITQKKNKLLCDSYQYITADYDNLLDKIKAVQKQDPRMLQKIFSIGKTQELFARYKHIEK